MNKINIFKKISVLALVLFAFIAVPNTKVKAFDLTAAPTGISVNYYDGIDSRGFSWQTNTSVTDSYLLVAKNEGHQINWDSITPTKGYYNDLNGWRCHQAYVTDLEPGNYVYKVGSPNAYSTAGTFTVDGSNDDKVSFTYVTDSQEETLTGFGQFNKTLKAATAHDPDFIAFAGDLVNNSHADWGNDMSKIVMEEWAYCFNATKDYTMNYPLVSTAGNHESAGYSFVYHNTVNWAGKSSTGGYYSFDYENLHFIVLNTNMFESYNQTEIDKQIAWLEQDLANNDANWTIVMLHIGAYSTGDHSHDPAANTIRNLLPPIFAKYKVDFVLQGHDHVYTRTLPYYFGEDENGKIPNREEMFVEENGLLYSYEPDGTYYITINYAGTKSYPPVDYDTSRIFPAKSPVNGKYMSQEVKNRMYAHFEIDGDTLVMKSYINYEDGTDELYDYVAIKKNTYLAVEEAVNKLPETITVDDVVDLKNAYDLANGLSDRAYAYLSDATLDKLASSLDQIDLEDGLAAYEVIETIKNIDTANYDDEFWSAYEEARHLYYNLSASQMELVYNKDVLLDIKDNLEEIKQATVNGYLVQCVQNLINGITNSDDKEKARIIAKMAYEALTEEQKALISGADILTESFVENNPSSDDKGCKGAVLGSITSILVLAFGVVVIKRRRGDDNE